MINVRVGFGLSAGSGLYVLYIMAIVIIARVVGVCQDKSQALTVRASPAVCQFSIILFALLV
jgi:uncharacterized membrane protein YhiD involved in acid resistance